MTKRLDEQHEWGELCEYIIEQIRKHVDGKLNRKKFTEWFMAREGLGLMFDYKLVYRCFEIWKQLHHGEQDHVVLICGKTGFGKSHLAAQLACFILPETRLDSFVYNAEQVIERFEYTAKRWETDHKSRAVVFDEGTRDLFSREAMRSGNRELTKLLFEIRALNQLIIVCAPSFFDLDKTFRRERVSTLIRCDKGYTYKGWTQAAVPKIVAFGEKYRTYNIECPVGSFWTGHWNSLYPEQLKRDKYVKHKMDNILRNIERSKRAVGGGSEYLTTGVAARLLGLSVDSVRRLVDTGKLDAIKIGKTRRVVASSVDSFLREQNA